MESRAETSPIGLSGRPNGGVRVPLGSLARPTHGERGPQIPLPQFSWLFYCAAMSENYLHGYHPEERDRLARQARFLEPKVYSGLDFSGVTKLLEVGSGNGAQSEIILERWPSLRLTGVDVSGEQVSLAQVRLGARSAFEGRWEFTQTDASLLPFAEGAFDGAFFCWVLEHVANPKHILRETKRVLAPGGKVFLTEVFNHSFYAEPAMPALAAYWQKYNTLQTRFAGDPQVGAKLGQYLDEVGFVEVVATPRTFFFDRRQPIEKKAMFHYWRDLLMSAAPQMTAQGLATEGDTNEVRKEMDGAADSLNSIFYYSFVQAEGTVPG